jgi:4-alpha-glucanotransferase
VLDPGEHRAASLALVTARADKTFAEYDGVRIDHPHGLVCPWVYRADAADPGEAVRAGARLFESPDLPDHPALAPYAIARPEQIDRGLPRHADGWVRELAPAQIERYAILFDAIVAAAGRAGRSRVDLSCEVLSTLPLPLRRVLERHGLGRWRVLQKANLEDPDDVYRAENANPEDWVMLGNHDTPAIFALIRTWPAARREAWIRHLIDRLHLAPAAGAALEAHPGLLAAAMFAELLASRAENVMVFFADLFGLEDRFNVPGSVTDANWSLRLPPETRNFYAARLARGTALDLPLAAALALRARGQAPALIARLAAAAAMPLPAGA